MAARHPAVKVAALVERMGRLLITEGHAEGLLPVHWETLRYLYEANQFSRNLAGLTDYLGSTKGTVSQTLKGLEHKGLIEKEIDVKDRRTKRLALTQEGRQLLKQDPLRSWGDDIETLPKREQEALERSLSTILRSRLAARGRAPFGQCLECIYFASKHEEGEPHYCSLLNVGLSEQNAQQICVEQEPRKSAAQPNANG